MLTIPIPLSFTILQYVYNLIDSYGTTKILNVFVVIR